MIFDGEFLELDDGQIIPPEAFEPILAGPKWNRVKLSATRSANRRGLAWRACAMSAIVQWARRGRCRGSHRRYRRLPDLLNARTGGRTRNRHHGKGIAAVVASASPDRIAASAGARTGLVDDAGLDPDDRQRIESLAVGSVPFSESR